MNDQTLTGAGAQVGRRTKEASRAGPRARVTGLGWMILILSVLILAAAFNTGTNLLYVMVATALASMLVSLWLSWTNLRRLELELEPPRSAHAGRPASVSFRLANGKHLFGAYGIGIRALDLSSAREGLSAYFLRVGARTGVTHRTEVEFTRRGLARIDWIEISSLYPFGWLEFRRRIRRPAEVLVYPRLVEVEPLVDESQAGLGMRETTSKGHGSGLFSIRSYVSGDPARSIHWKLSAKGAGLKVREFESEDLPLIELVLDFQASVEPTAAEEDAFERAISVTASLAKYFLDVEYEVGLWTNAGAIPAGPGPEQFRRIMRTLALAEIKAFGRPSGRAAPSGRGATIVIGPDQEEASAPQDPRLELLRAKADWRVDSDLVEPRER